MSSNAPDAAAGQEDFIKGWPHPELLTTEKLRKDLAESFAKAIPLTGSCLNYGAVGEGAHMLGHPVFLNALATFLTDQYGREVSPDTLMSTGGSSMATDIACRVHASAGDIAVTEAPTYYLAHQMFRERGLQLREVPLESDGMDVDALEKLCEECAGKVKIVYTVPINHNPTGVTMCNAKREKLMALARKHKFTVIADEAYQLLNFPGNKNAEKILPMFYHDSKEDPRCISVGTFSKLIGPGIKIGWAHADRSLLKPMSGIGFINSGNNPVIFSSTALAHFVSSGALKEHIDFVAEKLGKKCKLLCDKLREAGLEPVDPHGGYFVWVKSKGKMTGRSGKGMCLDPPDRFADYMRLCFAWLTEEQIVKGAAYLKQN